MADPRHSISEQRYVLLGFSSGRRLLAVMFVGEGTNDSDHLRRRATRSEQGNYEKTRTKVSAGRNIDLDEILPEYDFSRGSRNKYAPRYVAGSTVVVLDPDVAVAFPSSTEANEALRALAGIIQKNRSRGAAPTGGARRGRINR